MGLLSFFFSAPVVTLYNVIVCIIRSCVVSLSEFTVQMSLRGEMEAISTLSAVPVTNQGGFNQVHCGEPMRGIYLGVGVPTKGCTESPFSPPPRPVYSSPSLRLSAIRPELPTAGDME